jgi:hypothetical protein
MVRLLQCLVCVGLLHSALAMYEQPSKVISVDSTDFNTQVFGSKLPVLVEVSFLGICMQFGLLMNADSSTLHSVATVKTWPQFMRR